MSYGKENLSMMVREIIILKLKSELDELADKYDIPVGTVENLAIRLYVTDTSKVQWKSSKTKFIKLFEKEIKILFDEKIVTFQELGFLMFLGVYFTTFEDNCLRNEDGSHCKQKDIIEKSGQSKQTISRLMKGLVDKKLIFEKKHESAINAKRYMISPYILYRGQKMDRKKREILVKIKEEIMDLWENYTDKNEDVTIKQLNLDGFEPELFISMLEEGIVSECLTDKYEVKG